MASKQCGGGDKPCAHGDHWAYWYHKGIGEEHRKVLNQIKEGKEPTDRFTTAHLISIQAVHYDGGKLKFTDRSQCALDYLTA